MNRRKHLILALAFLMIAFLYAILVAKREPALSPDAKRAIAAIRGEAIKRGWKRFKIDAPIFKDADWVTTVRVLPEAPGGRAYVRVRDGALIEWSPGL